MVAECVILHTAKKWFDPTRLREEILQENPNIDLDIAHSYRETQELSSDARIVLAAGIPTEIVENAEDLQWIHALTSGVDSYDLDRIREENIILTNSSGVHSEAIAQQVLCYLLLFERRIYRSFHQQHQNYWRRYTGGELGNKTLGIIGLGSVGCRVAELVDPIDMRVIGAKRDPDSLSVDIDGVYSPEEIHKILKKSDYLIISCPLTEKTQNLIGEDEFITMKSSSIIINIARGEIIDEDALIAALNQNWIRGAALDVFEEEPLPKDSNLWNLPNVLITPHMAGTTPHFYERISEIFVPNYVCFKQGNEGQLNNRVL